MKWAVRGIVCQHFAHFLRKAIIALNSAAGIVCPDIETTGQVIIVTGLTPVMKQRLMQESVPAFTLLKAQITFLMCLVCVM